MPNIIFKNENQNLLPTKIHLKQQESEINNILENQLSEAN
jgi:hypothetical protein